MINIHALSAELVNMRLTTRTTRRSCTLNVKSRCSICVCEHGGDVEGTCWGDYCEDWIIMYGQCSSSVGNRLSPAFNVLFTRMKEPMSVTRGLGRGGFGRLRSTARVGRESRRIEFGEVLWLDVTN